jgi:GAF domain-containing protein
VRDDYGHPLYVISQIQDITERKQAEVAEREQRELAEALRDAAQALSSTRNLDELLDRILQSAQRIVPHDVGAILLIDDQGGAYMARLRDDTGRTSEEAVSAVRFSVAETANLHVMAEFRRPQVIPDTDHFPGWIHLENAPTHRVGAPLH